jgi:hypothetical protein
MEDLDRQVRDATQAYQRRVAPHPLFPHADPVGAPRDQGVNHSAIAAVAAALTVHGDLTPWTMRPAARDRYSLAEEFGIRPEPLFGFNSPSAAAELFRRTFGVEIDAGSAQLSKVYSALQRLEQQQLLGRSTLQKMGYVRDIAGKSLQRLVGDAEGPESFDLIALLGHSTVLLERQLGRLGLDHAKVVATQAALDEFRDLKAFFVLHRLYCSGAPALSGRPAFYELFADSVVDTIAARHGSAQAEALSQGLICRRGKGIEVVFHPRNRDFIWLGDVYGDCTAKRVRSQVDDRIANIHWAVYPWLLDPYYRVLEVLLDGRPAIKCHILPLHIHQRNLLMLDAIEVVPQLRERKDGTPNPDMDTALHEQRFALLRKLFEVCENLATGMGLEAIYVEKFSNAKWVRDEIDKLPDDGYHIAEVQKPFGTGIIAENVRYFTGAEPGPLKEEIQARNPWLMHRALKRAHKDVGVLRGRRSNWRLEIAGP